jgi:hypothetical protein
MSRKADFKLHATKISVGRGETSEKIDVIWHANACAKKVAASVKRPGKIRKTDFKIHVTQNNVGRGLTSRKRILFGMREKDVSAKFKRLVKRILIDFKMHVTKIY